MNLNRIAVAGALTIGVVVTASAQTNATPDPLDPDTESVRPLPPIMVSATRTEQDPRSLGSAVTIITAQELADSRVSTVLEALRQVPGVEVVQSGGPGRRTSVFIRGHNSTHTLIMLDGVRLNSNTLGGYDMANIPVNNIERLEIVRGAQGALYGSDAVGGVVNIVTKRGPQGIHGSVESAAGTGGYRSGGVALNGGNETGDFSIGYSGNRFNGTSMASKKMGNTENDEWINHAFSGRFGLNFLEDGRADLTLNHSRDNADVDGWNNLDDLNAEQRRRNLSGKFTVSKPVVDWYTQTLSVGLARENLEGLDPDTAGTRYTINNETRTFSAKSDFVPFMGDTVSVGYDFESQHGANPDTLLDQTLDIHSVFIQNHWTFEDITSITAGVRHDNHETFGGYTTYRLAASTKVPDTGLRFHGSLGTGFRAPTLNDLYWPTISYPPAWGGGEKGNPNLMPETSKSFDLGVEQSLWGDRVIADVTCFHDTVKQLIDWAQDGGGWWSPSNIDQAEIQGIETSLILRPIRPLDLKLAYTLTDARDAATGEELARRPRHRASASATYRVFKGASITLSGTRVGERYDNKPNVDTLDSYVRFDLAATYDVTENLQFFGRIENMFDENYEEAKGYGITGRYAFLGAKLSF
jgi:vitamin B12 transporter